MTTTYWFLKEQPVEETFNIHSFHVLEQLKMVDFAQQSLHIPASLTEYASQVVSDLFITSKSLFC